MSDPASLIDYDSLPTRSNARRDRWLVRLVIAVTLLTLLATIVACLTSPYMTGRRNEDETSTSMLTAMAEFVACVMSFGVIFVIALRWMIAGRWRLVGLSVVMLAVTLGIPVLAQRCVTYRFNPGFVSWVLDRFDRQTLSAIESWDKSLPASATTHVDVQHWFDPPASTEISASQWPPAIAALGPHRVTRVTDGVLCEWGKFGTWGTCRRVLVANHSLTSFDDGAVLFGPYQQVAPNVWYGVQIPG